MVFTHYEEWNDPISFPFDLSEWLSLVCESESKALEEVNVIFCSDDYLLEINKTHLNHDYYTDIITFDYCVDYQVFGDMFISVDRVLENARAQGVDWKDELARVLVHGILHLVGYGDKSEEEVTLMRSREDFYLSLRPQIDTV